jgi:hypothetical protein
MCAGTGCVHGEQPAKVPALVICSGVGVPLSGHGRRTASTDPADACHPLRLGWMSLSADLVNEVRVCKGLASSSPCGDAGLADCDPATDHSRRLPHVALSGENGRAQVERINIVVSGVMQ